MMDVIRQMRAKERSGFSLIELLVVIVIIGILTGFIIPNFQKFLLRIKLQNSARMVTTTLRKASRMALSDRCEVQVWIYTMDAAGPSAAGKTNLLEVYRDKDIRVSVDTWENVTSAAAQMIYPINIPATSSWSHGTASPDGGTAGNQLCQIGFSKDGTSDMRTIYVTSEPAYGGQAPYTEFATTPARNENRLDYNVITTLSTHRCRHYAYLHQP